MRTETAPQTTYLKDYKPYPFVLDSVDLSFDLHEDHSTVTSALVMGRAHEGPLFLHGEDLELLELSLNDAPLNEGSDYKLAENGLEIICALPDHFTLKIKTKIDPANNTYLEGLYKSGGNFCTQCEAEGFRRITYFPDRPDVMSVYTVRIEADKAKYPVLLSNGNKVESGDLEGGRHYSVWHDPWKKPCYLFALVAGDLTHIHDTYTTGSGREVDLYIYVRPGDEEQCDHAMDSLKRSMKWDEEVYGLEYDLDLFNIVAVSDFNMGAMENKSLNIFNTALVLAHPRTATDTDFMRVEGVIAHEYFHNWSGNRVTCRDWFQLSLKEGLTVFRDQEFSADTHSPAVQRIDDVQHLRRFQFPEDAGPLAHPIRPDNYIEINNFYTMTVYEKGAEIIRMFRTILGHENYRKATDLYFSRHDGQAATCDNWFACMEEFSPVDLSQFKLWYQQAGTPTLTARGTYDPDERAYTLTLSQSVPLTPGQPEKKPMHIPVSVGLIGYDGYDLILDNGQTSKVLHLKEAEQSFVFENVDTKPVPSILRGFSAPVILKSDLSEDDYGFLMVSDSDGFNRWDSAQTYTLKVLQRLLDDPAADVSAYLTAYGRLLDEARISDDPALMARLIAIPDVTRMALEQEVVDTDALDEARTALIKEILDRYWEELAPINVLNAVDPSGDDVDMSTKAMGERALRNTAFGLMAQAKEPQELSRAGLLVEDATAMTDKMAGFAVACHYEGDEAQSVIQAFYSAFKDYQLVVDKWFAGQAAAVRSDIIEVVKNLRQHPEFNIKNPNRVRSLYASFAMNNPVSFHRADGAGYELLKDAIIELNIINPQIAARLLTPFREWRRYTPDRQEKMKAALQDILAVENLSPNVYEIASKSLADA